MPIAVLISGGGTTLRNLIEKIDAGELNVRDRLVISSNRAARGCSSPRRPRIPLAVIETRDYASQDAFSQAIFDRCRAGGRRCWS